MGFYMCLSSGWRESVHLLSCSLEQHHLSANLHCRHNMTAFLEKMDNLKLVRYALLIYVLYLHILLLFFGGIVYRLVSMTCLSTIHLFFYGCYRETAGPP